MAKKDYLKEMEMEGPAGAAPFEPGEEDLADMEMPEDEEAPSYSADDVKKLYEENPEFAAEVNPLLDQYMEMPEGEEEAEGEMEMAEEEMPEEDEDLFA